ncbi:hypothetical protein AcW1_008362 [Taiwanofungus camphoratus]|nr:hypothetical protein AcW1_008362 [Antrodia cinnamomea]KAI0956186.1 hypothetical protein AcV7_006647 [Antrodia cinnamomea]
MFQQSIIRRISPSMQAPSSLGTVRARSKSPILTLPRLPVPDLHQTLEKYIQSLEPFFLEDEARGGPSSESSRSTRVKWAQDFERGIGRLGQERLIALDKESPNNWLDDNIWLKKAYHEWRAPLLINSNWWLVLNNDPNVPSIVLHGLHHSSRGGYTDWQIRRASWLVHRVLDWKTRLERQELYPDTTRAGIWLRETTAKMFNISRLPQPHCDAFSPPPYLAARDARTLLLLLHDWFYVVEVLDEDLKPHPPGDIERRIRAAVLDVEARLDRGEKAVPVGVLSADERDRWAQNLQHILSLSPQNHEILRKINHSIFALSLDHYTYVLPGSSHAPSPPPDSVPEVTAHRHNIRSGDSSRPAHNRWFDKPFTVIVESNTRSGVLGEHSPCDALVPSIVAEYAVVQGIDELAFEKGGRDVAGGWERLDWVVDEHIDRECVAAEERARAIVADSDDGFLWYTTYGADWIKNTARLSPDAYVQMAIQLAWYRTRGCFTATYETALTRLFKNGRTETIRTLTADSRAFVLAMVDPQSTAHTRYSLLRRAIQTHTILTRHAATGRGIDRHLLGLQLMLQDIDAGEGQELFKDALFAHSQTWKLSTSGLSAGYQFRGTG